MLSLRVERLEQQLEKIKSENLGNIKNDLWFKYRSDGYNMLSKIYDVMSKYPIIFWLIVISFIISTLIINYTSINKTPSIIIIILIFCLGCFIHIFPIIFVFFQLRIYHQLRNPKNFIKILICIGKFLEQSLTTFIIVIGFPLSLYFILKIFILKNIGSKIIELPSNELRNAVDKTMQGQDLTAVMYILISGIPLLTCKASHILVKSYLQTLNNKWKYYKPTYFFSISTLLLISLFIIYSFTAEIPAFIRELEEELRKNDMVYATKFVSDILIAHYQFYLI